MSDKKTIAAELLRLSTVLKSKAETAEALAAEALLANERSEEKRQQNRAANATRFAEVCTAAARMLESPRKPVVPRQRAAKPESLNEVIEWSKTNLQGWPESDIREWYNHFESNGWLVSGKTPMQDWKAAAANGFARWKKLNPQRASRVQPDEDETLLWLEFLKSKGLPIRPMSSAPSYMQDDFRTWLKSR